MHNLVEKMWTRCALVFVIFLGTVSCFPEGRVVNGTSTTIGKYPFMVSLRLANGVHTCGASIIAPRWILTAAHCVVNRTANQLSVQFASTTISRQGANVSKVEQIIVHGDYSPADSYANDIALLKLTEGLVYDYVTVAPVALPYSYFEVPQTEEGAKGVLIGWGLNATGGSTMPTLQEVDVKIYSDIECQTLHGGNTNRNQLCGGVDEGGKGQCSGDSGGPLLYKGSIQLGVVSWSIKPCGVKPYPGVYTKVSHYLYWIRWHIQN